MELSIYHLQEVFQHLDWVALLSCENVCKFWHKVLDNEVVWKIMLTRVCNKKIDENSKWTVKVKVIQAYLFLQNRQKVFKSFSRNYEKNPIVSYKVYKEGNVIEASTLRNLWTDDDVMYDLNNGPVFIEYDTMLTPHSESMVGFSANRESWQSGKSDAISLRFVCSTNTLDACTRVRKNMYSDDITYIDGFTIPPNKWAHISIKLSLNNMEVKFTGEPHFKCNIQPGLLAPKGYFGILSFRSNTTKFANIMIANKENFTKLGRSWALFCPENSMENLL